MKYIIKQMDKDLYFTYNGWSDIQDEAVKYTSIEKVIRAYDRMKQYPPKIVPLLVVT